MARGKTTRRTAASKAKETNTKEAPEKKATTKRAPAKNAEVNDAPVKTRASLARKAKAKSKNIYVEESEEEADEEIEVDENEDEDVEVVEGVEVEKKPIFTVFNADEKLDEGLCLIRSLGDGKYELVNLEYAPRADIATEETGEIIKAIPGRRDMLAITTEQWEDAKLKADLAVKSADGELFRLTKLPIELRYKIYEEVLIAVKPLHKKRKWTNDYYGLGLLLSCRQMYQESLTFLYRNTFRLNGLEISSLSKTNTVFQSRVRDLDFWWPGYVRDSATFRWIAGFPQLKILRLSYYCANDTRNRNTLYQDHDAVSWGPHRSHGFDSLVRLRGLEKVTVSEGFGTKDEKKAFETFLMRILTLPKEVPQPKAVKQHTSPGVAAAAKKS